MTHCIGCGKRLHNIVKCGDCGIFLCSEVCFRRHVKTCPAAKSAQTRNMVLGCLVLLGLLVACPFVLAGCGGCLAIFSSRDATSRDDSTRRGSFGAGPSSPAPPKPRPLSTDPTEVLAEFRQDAEAARSRYAGRGLTLTGRAKLILALKEGENNWLLFVGTDDKPVAQCVVPLSERGAFVARLPGIKPEPVRVACRFTGASLLRD